VEISRNDVVCSVFNKDYEYFCVGCRDCKYRREGRCKVGEIVVSLSNFKMFHGAYDVK
jgi:hypothetical protein